MLRTAIIRFALLNGDANLILWINAFFCHLEKENAIAVSIRHVAVFRLVAYLQGLPLWSSSLALVKDGQAILALVYDPCHQELVAAEVGRGTTLNGQPVSASAKTELRAAVVGTALPPFGSVAPIEHAHAARLLVEASKHVFVTRQMAAASLQLAYVAMGRLDAYLEIGEDVYDWMAGCLLVQEAGRIATSLKGVPFNASAQGVLAAAAGLHSRLHNSLIDVIDADS